MTFKVGTIRLNGKDYSRVRVTGSGERRYACGKCGTWVCDRCGHKRSGANRWYTGVHRCAKCGGMKGTWRVTYHTYQKWANHYGHVPTKDWVAKSGEDGRWEGAYR